MPSELHPAYLAAPPARRWRGGRLQALWAYLDRNSKELAPTWVGVILPGGARVALRVREDGQRELKLYRREGFETDQGPDLWHAEVATFARAFGTEDWYAATTETPEGGPVTTMLEPARLL